MRISDWSADVCSSDLGLAEGEKVVASGQFLIDSEASLSGIEARPIAGAAAAQVTAKPATYETVGRIEKIEGNKITLSHQPVPALNRSEERRVGNECVSTCRSRWWRDH